MERKEIEDVFRSYLASQRQYEGAKKTVARLEADAYSIKAPMVTGMPRGGKTADPTAEAVAQLATEKFQRAATRAAAAAIRYAENVEHYEQLVALVSDARGAEIIRLRWEGGIKPEFIPMKINVSRRTMWRWYNAAINEIEEKTKDGTPWH